MIDLSQHPNKQWAQKHPIPVAVQFAQTDGVCSTLEGAVAYRAGDAIMTGVADERWPIQRDKFEATYAPLTPTSMGQDGNYVKKPIPVLVLELTEPMQVKVGWQADPLQGQVGDWLVQYDADSYGIVSKAIFKQTYRIIESVQS